MYGARGMKAKQCPTFKNSWNFRKYLQESEGGGNWGLRYCGIKFFHAVLRYHLALRCSVFHRFGWRYSIKDPSPRYCGTVHLRFPVQYRSIQYATQNTVSIIHDLRNFWQLIYNLIVAVYNDRASWSLYRSIEVFSCFLTMAEVAQDVGGVITFDGWNFK